jgi:hypothetical protein
MPNSVEFVRANLNTIFSESSKPQRIMVAPARPNGFGWKVCLKGSFSDLAGRPTGPVTFVLTIEGGKLADRRRATGLDACDAETYSAI